MTSSPFEPLYWGMILLHLAPIFWAWAWMRNYRVHLEGLKKEDPNFNREPVLSHIRKARFKAFIMQLSITFLVGVGYGTLAGIYENRWIAYAPAVSLFLSIIVQKSIFFELEREIREIEASAGEGFKLSLRQFFAFFLTYGVYLLVLFGTVGALHWLAKGALSETSVGRMLELLATPFGIFLGLAGIHLLAPMFVRLMFPSKPLGNEGEDLEYRRLFESCFRKAGLTNPRMRVIELDHFQFHNAMVAGIKIGNRVTRAGLFVSRSLMKSLKRDELEGVILHEVSHLALNHTLKRFGWTFIAVLASWVPVFTFLVLANFFFPWIGNALAGVVCVFIAIFFQIWLLRKQVRKQELEADYHAVYRLGADCHAFIRALGRLEVLNGVVSPSDVDEHGDPLPKNLRRKKDPITLLNPASAHPTSYERAQALLAVRDDDATPPPYSGPGPAEGPGLRTGTRNTDTKTGGREGAA